jgi:hypothetical protein
MSRSNSLWGAPRIHGELLKLGLKVSEATVAKYMVPRWLRRGPGWHVFLRNELAGLRDSGLSVELNNAWDQLKGLWPWRHGLTYNSETRIVVGPGSGGLVLARIGLGLAAAFASMDSQESPGSELEKPFVILPVGGQPRDSPARPWISEDLRQQIELSELVCEAELYAERCAA